MKLAQVRDAEPVRDQGLPRQGRDEDRRRTASASYLNAGRGNPNWIATEPREAFFLLGQFAVTESKRVLDLPPGVGGMPQGAGHRRRVSRRGSPSTPTCPGAEFLAAHGAVGGEEVRLRADTFVHELVDSIIGDNYPVPDRMLVHNEQIVHEYLQWAMCGDAAARRASSSSTRSRAARRPCATSSSR